MALRIHTPLSFPSKPYPHHLPHAPPFTLPKPKFTFRSQNPIVDSDPSADPSPPKKASTSGLGFGSSSSTNSSSSPRKSTKKERRNGKSVIRRTPVEKTANIILSEEDEAKFEEQKKNESAFLLAWFGLGVIIITQGLILSASGFLPDEWDRLVVKYLYPVFTPTVGLFISGTVVYGVLKYLQNAKLKDQK